MSFLMDGWKGFVVQSFKFPGGTISTCPANIKFGFFVPNLAYKFLTGLKPFSLNSNIFVLKPSFLIFF